MAIEMPLRHRNESDTDSDPSDDTVSLWSGASDTSSEVTELDQEDFPGYFSERNGRLFHSHGTSPYPLPVDAAEQHVRDLRILEPQSDSRVPHRLENKRAARLIGEAPRWPLPGSGEACIEAWRACIGSLHGNGFLVSHALLPLTLHSD